MCETTVPWKKHVSIFQVFEFYRNLYAFAFDADYKLSRNQAIISVDILSRYLQHIEINVDFKCSVYLKNSSV